jgi:hypothetical protein
MLTATLLVERSAKLKAPVDNGLLRASITHEIRTAGLSGQQTVQGVVGSNKQNAVFMELGTGTFAGHPRVKMPPPSVLEVWAKRHNLNAFLVARAIWKAGGLKPRKFLQNAFEENISAIKQLIGDAVSGIVNRANGG